MATPLPLPHDDSLLAQAAEYAIAFHQRGMLAEAEKFYDAILVVRPDHLDALRLLGVLRQQQGDNAAAMRLIGAALRLNPRSVDALGSFAGVLYALGRYEEALAAYDDALRIEPHHLETLNNRGTALLRLERNHEALAAFDRALTSNPGHLETLINRGSALLQLGRIEEALAAFDSALETQPDNAVALSNRSTALKLLGRYEDALACCRRALDIAPDDVSALNDYANLLLLLGRAEAALAGFDRSLAVAADQPAVLACRADLLRVLARHGEAVAAYDRILARSPHDQEALYNRGKSLWALGNAEEAIDSYEQARAFDHPRALSELALCRLRVADWAQTDALAGAVHARIAEGDLVDPFVPAVFGLDPLDQMKAAAGYARHRISAVPAPFIHSPVAPVDKLRIAYLSSDFRRHPVGLAIAELLERHDKRHFEIIGVSYGADDASSTRARIVEALDGFHEAGPQTDATVARLVNGLGVHIAVDLNGLTGGCRPGVLAYRPAPIQVGYLGFAGTAGSEFTDYILADATVLPFDQQPFFTEKIVHLPDCYHANDTTRPIAQTPPRRDLGLPDQGFVFCCFNQSYKIAAPVFDVWMRLLARVQGSVLWLSKTNDLAQANLRRTAAARGVDPERLVFAPWMDRSEDHLARHRAADLFLDTLPYNAHSTAIDALWAGLPVLTCAGTAFAGRVGASLLKAAGLPELVTHGLADYEAMALRLAGDPALLSSIRRKLADNRPTCALFDGDRFRRQVEAAYAAMWDIHRRGERPRGFCVAPAA